MDLLFLGGLFPKHLENEIIRNSKGEIQYAANNLQWALIKGFELINKNPVQLCNVLLIGSYPKGYKKLFIKTEKFSHHTEVIDTNYGFFNLYGLSMFFRFFAAMKGLINWPQNKNGKKILIIYSIHTPFLLASYIKTYFSKNIKLCLIASDLPEYMSDRKNIIYRALKALDKQIINLCLKRIDAFVLLSDLMQEKLNIGQKAWVCVEGIFDNSMIKYETISKGKHKVILYTGTLAARYGLLNVLDAFEAIKKDNYELWICGDGDTKDEIIERMKKDSRIKYYGLVQRERALMMQQQATVLVNPRTSEGDFTKYSFPSKIMEYFASGTPTIMHRLPGIPEEYYNYCFIADQEDAEGLFKTIINVCEMDQMVLNEMGRNAQKFIFEQKNPKTQVGKIVEMISEL